MFNKSILCIAGEKCSFQMASLMCLTWNCWYTTNVKNSDMGIKFYVTLLIKGKSYKTLKILLKQEQKTVILLCSSQICCVWQFTLPSHFDSEDNSQTGGSVVFVGADYACCSLLAASVVSCACIFPECQSRMYLKLLYVKYGGQSHLYSTQ